MSLSPLGWRNFIQDLKDKKIIDDRNDPNRVKILNRELEQYSATLYYSSRNCFLEFRSKKYYTMFVVKYGGNL